MKLSLVVDYKKLPADVKSAPELTRFLIGEAMQRRFPQGMPRLESRIYGKLLDQLYTDSDTVEIDQTTLDLVKETLDQATLPAHCSAWKWALLDALEAAGKA